MLLQPRKHKDLVADLNFFFGGGGCKYFSEVKKTLHEHFKIIQIQISNNIATLLRSKGNRNLCEISNENPQIREKTVDNLAYLITGVNYLFFTPSAFQRVSHN